MRSLPLWAAAVWWGSLSTLGFFVVPMLFLYLPSPALAGGMAARLFSVQTIVSALCCAILLLSLSSKWADGPADTARTAIVLVATGLLCALLVELGVAPKIVARDNLALWHRVGSALYLLQWVCATLVQGTLIRSKSQAAQD